MSIKYMVRGDSEVKALNHVSFSVHKGNLLLL